MTETEKALHITAIYTVLTVRNWKIMRMRFFIFAISLALLQAKNILSEKRYVWSKLDQYQELTGISAEKIMAIWQRSQVMKSSDQQGCIKFSQMASWYRCPTTISNQNVSFVRLF